MKKNTCNWQKVFKGEGGEGAEVPYSRKVEAGNRSHCKQLSRNYFLINLWLNAAEWADKWQLDKTNLKTLEQITVSTRAISLIHQQRNS